MFSVELYARVRYACHVEGLSTREAARRFGLHRTTVRKMLAHAVPPGYRRALSNSPMALDVYAWLAQRLHPIPRGRVQEISSQSLYEQFGHGFVRTRKFKESF